jgi:hypothetical protein
MEHLGVGLTVLADELDSLTAGTTWANESVLGRRKQRRDAGRTPCERGPGPTRRGPHRCPG